MREADEGQRNGAADTYQPSNYACFRRFQLSPRRSLHRVYAKYRQTSMRQFEQLAYLYLSADHGTWRTEPDQDNAARPSLVLTTRGSASGGNNSANVLSE